MRMRHELYRKLLHFGLIIVLILHLACAALAGEQASLLLITALTCAVVLIDWLRIRHGIVWHRLDRLLRHEERSTLSGASMAMIGLLIAIAVFPRPVAVLAVLMLAVGDATAGLLRTATRMRSDEPRIECFLAELFINLLLGALAVVFVPFTNWPWVVLAMALVAATTENLLYGVDDNLAVPLISGLVGSIVYLLI